MNQPDDKPLHDRVRQLLADYQPTDEPAEWKRLQRRLRQRRWRRGGLLLGGILVGLGVMGWLAWSGDGSTLPTQLARPSTVLLSKRSVSAPAPLLPIVSTHQRTRQPIGKSDRRTNQQPPRDAGLPGGQVAVIEPLAPMMPLGQALSTDLMRQYKTLPWSREENAITEQVISGQFGDDSTSYRVLERNLARWPDAVIVCDLTTSMYPYSTQVVSWLRRQVMRSGPLGLVFFTDCDSLGRQTRPGGPPGQMYIVANPLPETLLSPLVAAARNTVRNKDDAENNVEALLVAQQTFPSARHLILVADNLSRVKDMAQLGRVTHPVHVILCGTTGGTVERPFQVDYEQIARQTKGSLHTLEDDLDPAAMTGRETLHVGDYYYRYTKRRGQFKLTQFGHRPRRWLGFIWL